LSIKIAGVLPTGVRAFDLGCLVHERGSLTEIYRQDWWPHGPARQWNLVTSARGVLRGIHIHLRDAEYYALVAGKALIGYRDVRPGSPTHGAVALVELAASRPVALAAPPGLAHGVYCLEPFTLLVGTTGERDQGAEAGCHWRDPDLEIPWPFETAIVSAQDDALGCLRDVLGSVPRYQDDGWRG
jgi:dTDP-4-dehydrorhamnose 3,5-epimerase